MTRSFKIFGTAFLILGIISLAAVIALWLFFPAEYVRDTITRELSDRLNQDITMSTISVGFYPDPELAVQNLRVVDSPSAREIVSAEQVRFNLDVWDLFKRRVVIQDITVTAPRIDLARDAQGAWNVETLIENVRSGEEKPETLESVSLIEFDTISIEKAFITINDESLGQQIQVSNFTASIDIKAENLIIDSASIVLPPVAAEVEGRVEELFESAPILDMRATLKINKEGPLADMDSINVPAGTRVADISLEASGNIKEIILRTTFSSNPLVTAEILTKGDLRGTLKTEEGLFTVDALNAHFGENTLALSGIMNNLWKQERTGDLKGTANISLEEVVALAKTDTLSNFDLTGMVTANIALTASTEQLGLNTNIDLNTIGFSVPHLMNKQQGTPASLAVKAQYTLPDELIIDSFDLVLEKDNITGNAQVQAGTDPGFQVSLATSSFSLAHLNQIPVVGFPEGSAGISAKIWQAKSSSEDIQYSGDITLDNATLTVKPMNEPFKKINGQIKVAGQKADISKASFLFGESTYRLEAEIKDLTTPNIRGKVHGDGLDVNRIIAAFKKPKDKPENKTSSSGTKGLPFSLELDVEADEMLLDKFRAGAVSTTWHTTGRVQRFHPVQIAAFGGTLGGTFELAVMKEGTTWKADCNGQKMKLEELWPQLYGEEKERKAKGLFNAEGALSGGGSSPGNGGAWETLNGQLVLSATDATFIQSSLFRNILLATAGPVGTLFNIATLKDHTLDANSLFFKTVNGTFHVTNGKALTEDLYFDGSAVDFRFKGNIDFVKNYMDMRVQAIPLATVGALMGKIPLVGEGLDKAKRAVLSYKFNVTGPITDPEAELEATEETIEETGVEE